MTSVTEAPALWLGTSWKMTKTLAEARAFVDEIGDADIPAGIQVFVLPAHTSLAAVRDRLGVDSPVLLGAQNAHPGPEGAVTGEVSMRMIRDAGAQLVEIGHVERRTGFGETDEFVAAKTAAALREGLTPLVCIGETLEQRRGGEAVAAVTAQVRAAFDGLVSTTAEVLVAYEPHWAVGTGGSAAAPDDVAGVIDAVRQELASLLPGADVRLLYGGSVDVENARELLSRLPIDGLFVGRAAWTASGLVALAQHCGAVLQQSASDALTHPDRRER